MAKKTTTSKPTPRASKTPAKLRSATKLAKKHIAKRQPAPRPSASPSRWPFLDAPSFAVISLHRVFDKAAPATVTMVVHDDDGSWQFLDGGEVSEADASVVALHTMMEQDPTLLEVATLPRGWYAVRRSPTDAWWPIPSGQSVGDYYGPMSHPRSAE